MRTPPEHGPDFDSIQAQFLDRCCKLRENIYVENQKCVLEPYQSTPFHIYTLYFQVGILPLFPWFLIVRHIFGPSQTTLKYFPERFLKSFPFLPL